MPSYLKISISGLVQGVGFRPLCFAIAEELSLRGCVYNADPGVIVEVDCGSATADKFINQLKNRLPDIARIDSVEYKFIEQAGIFVDFSIRKSETNSHSSQVLPDLAICPECIKELFDPENHRYRYPLINCTHCGPRYSIIKQLPYDRPQTTMADFTLCKHCASEYGDAANRRFHAQPVACANCGPSLQLTGADGVTIATSEAVSRAVELIKQGKILAVKGIGGFHLACDAQNAAAVEQLRQRKKRPNKPFAVMAVNVASLKTIVSVSSKAESLLRGTDAPIVLQPATYYLPDIIAPKLNQLGVMLPYTPIHYLLFNELCGKPDGIDWLTHVQDQFLVMTSANQGGNPLTADNRQALSELRGIADYFLFHDRDIHLRGDDSIVNAMGREPIIIRRSRGMAPERITLPTSGASVLALGSQLKNTFCLTRGRQAFVSQYIGDLDSVGNRQYLQQTVQHLQSLLSITPEAVVVDMHPDFFGQQLANDLSEHLRIPVIQVQHHHAHAVAIMAEHQLGGPVLAVTLDGLGYGTDQTIWGGELLKIDAIEYFERLGHFSPLRLPGGDQASRQIWRIGLGSLMSSEPEFCQQHYAENQGFEAIKTLVTNRINCPLTSSAGRLFDAAASILGICQQNSFEAEAPMLLESLARQAQTRSQGKALTESESRHLIKLAEQGSLYRITDDLVLDFSKLLSFLSRLDRNLQAEGALLFHTTLANAVFHWIEAASQQTKIQQVVLSGGCWLNALLTDLVMEHFESTPLKVYQAKSLSPNDSGLSLGQALIGQQTLMKQ